MGTSWFFSDNFAHQANLRYNSRRAKSRCGSMVEPGPSKLMTRVSIPVTRSTGRRLCAVCTAFLCRWRRARLDCASLPPVRRRVARAHPAAPARDCGPGLLLRSEEGQMRKPKRGRTASQRLGCVLRSQAAELTARRLGAGANCVVGVALPSARVDPPLRADVPTWPSLSASWVFSFTSAAARWCRSRRPSRTTSRGPRPSCANYFARLPNSSSALVSSPSSRRPRRGSHVITARAWPFTAATSGRLPCTQSSTCRPWRPSAFQHLAPWTRRMRAC